MFSLATDDCGRGSIAEEGARDDGHPGHWLARLVSRELILQVRTDNVSAGRLNIVVTATRVSAGGVSAIG